MTMLLQIIAYTLFVTTQMMVSANTIQSSLRAAVAESMLAESHMNLEVGGVQNCYLKCSRVFDTTSYFVNAGVGHTFEYQACLVGCSKCDTDLGNATGSPTDCFTYCKNHDFIADNSIVKGVIEPDKACAMGCVIQLCQGVCIGGTPLPFSSATKDKYWPNGSPKGCSLKTPGDYSQYDTYIGFNTPLGPGGTVPDTATCCANALAFCTYPPSQITPGNLNYANLRDLTVRVCTSAVGSSDPTAICKFFADPVNCGSVSFPH